MTTWQELIESSISHVNLLNQRYNNQLYNFQALFCVDSNSGGIASIIKVKPLNSIRDEDGARIAINNIIPLANTIQEDSLNVLRAIITHEAFHHVFPTQSEEGTFDKVAQDFPELSQICEKLKRVYRH